MEVVKARVLTAAVAVAVLIGAFLVTRADEPVGYPFHLVGQGVFAKRLEGTEVFVIRDGSVVTVLGKTTPGTDSALVYCPSERFFVAAEDGALYDREGRYVQGPGTGDMIRYDSFLNRRGLLRRGRERTPRRSGGEISGEAGEAYLNWRSDPDTPQRFCQDPVR